MKTMLRISTLGLLLLTGACGDDAMTTEGSDSTSSASAEVTETGEASTTDAPPTTGDDSTTGDDTTTADATTLEPGTSTEATSEATTDATTGSDTTGEEPGDLAVCEDYCERWVECSLQPDLEGCVEGCVDSLADVPPSKCKTETREMLACTTTLSCEELPLLGDGDPTDTACGDQFVKTSLACEDGEANCSESAGGSDTECEVVLECDEGTLKMLCDEQTCTCYDGDEAYGECASEAICGESDGLFVKFSECCFG